jgi:hypothetical protein
VKRAPLYELLRRLGLALYVHEGLHLDAVEEGADMGGGL